MHDSVLDVCKSKQELYDKHLEDAPANREKIVKHDILIDSMCKLMWVLGTAVTGSFITIFICVWIL